MSTFIETANSFIWSNGLLILCVGAGLYFTFLTKFVQVTGIKDFFLQLFGKSSESGTSPFQSLSMSLASRVGIGNISGVAAAITFGGPGAVFWMWVTGFCGAATSFVEATVSQIYKEKDQDTGQYRGGPAYYIEKAYRHTAFAPVLRVLSIFSAVLMIFSTGFFLPGIQANGITDSFNNAWGVPPLFTGMGIVLVLGFVIIGGIKRIANFASIVVPFMAIFYILFALIILFVNFRDIPDVFGLIFRSAFNQESLYAGMLGSAIAWGVRRGVYSNEAGLGTSAQHAAAAEVSHPAKQGFVQAVSVYVDTLFVCSATAFIIISTDMYKVFTTSDETGDALYAGKIPDGITAGPGYVQAGLDSFTPGFGPAFVAIAIAFFAFTSVLACYYIAETNLVYISRWVKSAGARALLVWILRVAIIAATIIGSISASGTAWALGDFGLGLIAWFNIIMLLVLQVPVYKTLKDYRTQRKAGLDPQFDPQAIGIKNADFWSTRAREHTQEKVAQK